MTEKITGVCVDIPTVIREAKEKRRGHDCIHLDHKAEFDSAGFVVCSNCQQRYTAFSQIEFIMSKFDFRTLDVIQFKKALAMAYQTGRDGVIPK